MQCCIYDMHFVFICRMWSKNMIIWWWWWCWWWWLWWVNLLSTRPRKPLAARIAHPITAKVATEIRTLELMDGVAVGSHCWLGVVFYVGWFYSPHTDADRLVRVVCVLCVLCVWTTAKKRFLFQKQQQNAIKGIWYLWVPWGNVYNYLYLAVFVNKTHLKLFFVAFCLFLDHHVVLCELWSLFEWSHSLFTDKHHIVFII